MSGSATRSRADRIGQGIFVALVVGAIGALLGWLSSLAWGHWWFWPAACVSVVVVLVLAGSGAAAVLGPGKPRPSQRSIAPEVWVNGP